MAFHCIVSNSHHILCTAERCPLQRHAAGSSSEKKAMMMMVMIMTMMMMMRHLERGSLSRILARHCASLYETPQSSRSIRQSLTPLRTTCEPLNSHGLNPDLSVAATDDHDEF